MPSVIRAGAEVKLTNRARSIFPSIAKTKGVLDGYDGVGLARVYFFKGQPHPLIIRSVFLKEVVPRRPREAKPENTSVEEVSDNQAQSGR